MTQTVVAKPVTVIYCLNEDSSMVVAHVVTEGGVVANWGMSDSQCAMHIREIEKYRALLRPEAKRENMQ